MKHLCGARTLVLAGWCVIAGGCNMTQLAVETQAEVMEQAFPAIEEQTDYEFARDGIPANLVQIDGLLKVQPDNERLLMLATQGFTSYAYGFVEDDMQRAELAGDLEASDRYRARAREMYLKGRDYGLTLLRLMQSDFPEELPRDPDQLKKVLNELFTEPEQAPALFWTGNAWGSAINISRDDPALVADLPFTTVFVERSVELDEKYYHAAGHVFLGVANSALGESMGGDPEKGRGHLEKALALTGRKATLVQVNYAQAYAVQKNDKALFTKLVNEAIETPIPKGDLALPNTIAKRRAERLLAQVDTLIMTPLEDLPPAPADAPSDAPPEGAPSDGAAPESSATPPAAEPSKAPAPAAQPAQGGKPAPAPAAKPAPSPAAKPAPAPAGKPTPASPAAPKPVPAKPAQ
ncbi:MAG TPA: TRAP transporter TatT component family protein [Polyangiaceae bacterium]